MANITDLGQWCLPCTGPASFFVGTPPGAIRNAHVFSEINRDLSQ